MVAIRNGKILEQIKLEDGYRVVAQEELVNGSRSHIAIKVFKGRKIIFKNEMPKTVENQARLLYRRFNPQQG